MKGSIIKREGKDGAVSWLLKYDADRDAVTGKRQQRYKTVHGTKKAASVELRRLLSEVDNGTHVDPSTMTLSQWAERWLAELRTMDDVSTRTREGYASWLRVHVLPVLGSVQLQKIKPPHIRDLYVSLRATGHRGSAARGKKATDAPALGLAAQTVLHVHRTLYSCLKSAVSAELIARNPAEAAKAPVVKRVRSTGEDDGAATIKALDREQLPALLDAFRKGPLFVPVALDISTGLRRGEMLALRWSAIDFERCTLSVRQTVERTREHGVRIKAGAKNLSSMRTIGVDESLCDLLRTHRREQKELALKLGAPYPADSLVFPCVIKPAPGRQVARTARDVDFGRPWDPEAITKAFRRVVVRAGFGGLRLHDLRHTHATHLLLDGVPVHSVAKRLGHSTPVITLTTYAHVLKCAEEQAAQVSGAMLRAALRL